MKFIILCLFVAFSNCSVHQQEQLAHQVANKINNDLQGTSSSFSNLFQNHELSSANSSAKISVYLHASVLIKVESNGKTVVVNNSLLGGVQIRSNQIEPDQSDVNLLKLRSQVETYANDLGSNEVGIFIGALYNGNQTVVRGNETIQSADKSTFIGGHWLGIKSKTTKFN